MKRKCLKLKYILIIFFWKNKSILVFFALFMASIWTSLAVNSKQIWLFKDIFELYFLIEMNKKADLVS
jgi:hypothetical protein